ncbi:hypothetical protein S7711_07766 [Stachybotrys chartarum IBT 7711]|uniref:NB-ARC domain-containing protein n=1 Tax=Stachybotrys chartarum (strain CBS 109288 / IBT 7711) TaxID=1280523 RepID=A0A084B8P5_STACB|nr:hypothetical protein S7711_07766 [Stachybotrys chartarum IBT 7711]
MSPKKLQRTDYRVAWIAPLFNTYGTLAGHNVVIVTCPPGLTGNVNAGRITGPMFKTFNNLRMTLLVGIGGGIPRAYESDNPTENVHLGDVVVGWPGDGGPACIYYDLGRWYANGQFEMLGTIDKPDRVLLNALSKLASDHEMDRSTFQDHQERLLIPRYRRKFIYPGQDKDQLFKATYQHGGQHNNGCANCDTTELVERPARTEEDATMFIFHQGRIATGDAVVRDGKRRDQIRDQCSGALCVEMEAAGVDASRPCLAIRGISDYADSHKSDAWRSYAAGNAAVFARELLSKIPPSKIISIDVPENHTSHFLVPFGRNKGFVGRDELLKQLLDSVPPSACTEDCQRIVVEGLGGIGKTQLTIEVAHRVRDIHPDCSVFWVPAVSTIMFENAYREIGRALRIPGIDDDKADVKDLVKTALSRNDTSSWLLIMDNADDAELLFTSSELMSYIPFSRKGSILFTTRTHNVAIRLRSRGHIMKLGELNDVEAAQLLHQALEPSQTDNIESTMRLLKYLANLPLAIRQASAYMASNRNVTVSRYLEYCQSGNKAMAKLSAEDFDDQDRYKAIQNPISMTWLISFEHIKRDMPLAAEYLRFICYLAERDIPISLLPRSEDMMVSDRAISTLISYSFISQCKAPGRYDIHRLVRLIMRNWLDEQREDANQVTATIRQLSMIFPRPRYNNRDIWTSYLPHAQSALEVQDKCEDEWALANLLNDVGECANILGKYTEAERIYQQILKLYEKLLSKEHPSTLKSMNNLAVTFQDQGKHAHAEQMQRQTLNLAEKILGQEHPNTFIIMNNLVIALKAQGKHIEAERAARFLSPV